MKVIYVNHTIPLYTHPLLQKIVSKGCELVMLLPLTDNGTVGLGVEISHSEHNAYRILYSSSSKKWYGKAVLNDLTSILIQEKPDILMIGWPYMLQVFFERGLQDNQKS